MNIMNILALSGLVISICAMIMNLALGISIGKTNKEENNNE
jgi:hypothetical protein